MTEEHKSIREYVEKLADDKLAEVMGEDKKPVRRSWTEDARGGRWTSDELEWESYKPREDVARSQREFFAASKKKSAGYTPEDWAEVVRPQGGMVVLSDFMVTQMADIMMREMSDLLERAQLIYVSEAASQSVRNGMRKIIGEYVHFLDRRTGEYCDVEVE